MRVNKLKRPGYLLIREETKVVRLVQRMYIEGNRRIKIVRREGKIEVE